jgi:hypothetical protein
MYIHARNHLPLTLAAAVLLAIPGCIKSNSKTVLGKDGSGTVTMTATFDLAKLNSIKEMLGGMGINSLESLRGNRDHLRGVGLSDTELQILGVRHAGM